MAVKRQEDELKYKLLQGMFSDIRFDGVFRVEFLIDENDDLCFSEIPNKHLWGVLNDCI